MNVRNPLPLERLVKLQILLLFGALIGSPAFFSFTKFYMNMGQL